MTGEPRTHAEALLAAADRQNKQDQVDALREPARQLIVLLHNRAEALQDHRYYGKHQVYDDW